MDNSCFVLKQVSNRGEAHLELNAFRRKYDCALVISGDSLEVHCHSMEHTVISLYTKKIVWLKQQDQPNNAKLQTSKHISAETDILCQQFFFQSTSQNMETFRIPFLIWLIASGYILFCRCVCVITSTNLLSWHVSVQPWSAVAVPQLRRPKSSRSFSSTQLTEPVP